MQDSSSLYSQCCDALQKGDLSSVDSYTQSPFWNDLTSKERKRLATLILKGCEKKLRDAANDSEIEEHLLVSFKLAEQIAPALFQSTSAPWQLWGNLLVALGEDCHLEESLQKYARAAEIAEQTGLDTAFWKALNRAWGKAWVLLGKSSNEAADIQKGIEKFRKCTGNEPGFLTDYGDGLLALGALLGEIDYYEQAREKFTAALALNSEDSRAWILYAQCVKGLAELQGEEGDAEKVFQEAVLAVPDETELWLLWGELYLRLGWVRKDPGYIERALEKLTALTMRHCDPVRGALLLGAGLALLGLFLEDMKLIKEAEGQISSIGEIENGESLLASGLLALVLGLYFSEEKYFKQAARCFQKGVKCYSSSHYFWYGLFQSYVAWGELTQRRELICKGLTYIERVTELAPSASHFWNSWGVALMKSGERCCVEKAICKFKKALSIKPDLEWKFNYGCALDVLGSDRGDEKLFEEAIAEISAVYKEAPSVGNVGYHLALVLSHHGELTMNVENLYRAADIFATFVKKENDDDVAWCEWGYTLLNLAIAFEDPVSPQKGIELRSDAESKLLKGVAFGNGPANYHLACLYSLSGLYDLSMDYLRRAESHRALPQLEDLEKDEWLVGVRKTQPFLEFVQFRRKI